ncbi:hemolysin-type calcium-binding region [Ketogulonicigenium robustum]|uniref:Hemolysin-type calcium-binding region n=1 Tax=Ketogulonicigenium robustum TaxID=92947 RepID=A0A1W6NZA9_9RHOB|nr:Hint domain-containing protein [Ketogulonicigenium robustum]ARO14483.1 hemolysin-type calcium-binding region [Ketogulonicigenium robustum]
MAIHTVHYYAISDLTISPSWPVNSSDGAALLNGKFTIAANAELKEVLVNDDDPMFSDDDIEGQGAIWGQDGVGQSIEGTTTKIEAEYLITLSDGTNTYTAVAVATGGNNNVIGFSFAAEGGVPPVGVELTITKVEDSTQNADGSYTAVGIPYEDMIACFTSGTLIATPKGDVAIETLREGDLVLTKDHGPQPLRWIGSSKVSAAKLQERANLRPIRIRAGALGDNMPVQDLTVSPQHRVLLTSKIARNMFDATEVLVAAKQLLQIEGIDIVDDLSGVEYFHMLFDRHEIVVSNGAETESLFTGPMALKSLPTEAVAEIFAIFPELQARDYAPTPARVLLTGRQARRLVVRHIGRNRPLVAA